MVRVCVRFYLGAVKQRTNKRSERVSLLTDLYCTTTKLPPLDSSFENLSTRINSVSLHGFATTFSTFAYLQFCFVYDLAHLSLLTIYSRFLPCNLFWFEAINLAIEPLESPSKYLQTANILALLFQFA